MKCKNCGRDVYIYLTGGFCRDSCKSYYPFKVLVSWLLVIAVIVIFVALR